MSSQDLGFISSFLPTFGFLLPMVVKSGSYLNRSYLEYRELLGLNQEGLGTRFSQRTAKLSENLCFSVFGCSAALKSITKTQNTRKAGLTNLNTQHEQQRLPCF